MSSGFFPDLQYDIHCLPVFSPNLRTKFLASWNGTKVNYNEICEVKNKFCVVFG